MNKLMLMAGALSIATAPLTAGALTVTYNLNLDGGQEVPLPATVSSAVGSAQIIVNDSSNLISFTVVGLGLSGTVSGGHIHGPALAGASAGVVYNLILNADAAGPLMVGGSAVPNSYSILGTDKAIASSLAGMINAAPWEYYVNVHTTPGYPGGEIRGQLAAIPEPATFVLGALGLGVVGWAARRRRTPA
jgi:hypothetical protein